jgi:hypothetical protein
MRIRGAVLAVVSVSALVIGAAPAAAQTLDFETTAVGATTPLAVTSGGVTATFMSPETADAFLVIPSFFSTLSGNVLLKLTGDPATSLRIDFSQPLSALSLAFVTNGPGDLTLSAFQGATPVGSLASTGTVPGGVYTFPEGTLAFTGAVPFESVRLVSTALDFGINDLHMTLAVTSTVPEPTTLVLFGFGLLLLVGTTLGRQRAL